MSVAQATAAAKYAEARKYRDAALERSLLWDADDLDVWAHGAQLDAAALSLLARRALGVEP